jgi:hypothetical protein
MAENKWWGYIHVDGSVHAKRYYEPLDIEEAERSPFCKKIYGPFEVELRSQAIEMVKDLYRLDILHNNLIGEGYHNLKVIPGLGICGLRRFIYTTAIVVGIDGTGYKGRYCYPNDKVLGCLIAFETWNGKDLPKGDWIKYKGEGGEFLNPNMP